MCEYMGGGKGADVKGGDVHYIDVGMLAFCCSSAAFKGNRIKKDESPSNSGSISAKVLTFPSPRKATGLMQV